MIRYTDDLASVREDMLNGFFVGWPRRPSAAQHLAVLRAATSRWSPSTTRTTAWSAS